MSASRRASATNPEGWPLPLDVEPDLEQLHLWVLDGVCEATDGCPIEPDGICEHGHPAWLLWLGLV